LAQGRRLGRGEDFLAVITLGNITLGNVRAEPEETGVPVQGGRVHHQVVADIQKKTGHMGQGVRSHPISQIGLWSNAIFFVRFGSFYLDRNSLFYLAGDAFG
jgi:hypothetical protein